MSGENVTPLPTKEVLAAAEERRDREALEKLIGKLNSWYHQGKIKKLMLLCIDDNGAYGHLETGNMTLSEMALGLAYWQHDFNRVLQKQIDSEAGIPW